MSDAALSLAEQWILKIIRDYMQLPDAQIWIWNQNKTIPNDTKLYVTVGMVDSFPYASKSEIETVGVTPPGGADPYEKTVETVSVNMQENIQVTIQSRSNEAVNRRFEVLFALGSISSKQVQEEFSFKIARLPKSFLNASATEGGSNINKFTAVIPCLTMHSIEKVLDATGGKYYDDFKTRVDDENSIGTAHGIVEFEIDPDTPDPSQGV